MTDPIPDDLRKKAEDLCASLDIFPTYSTVTAIAQALAQERAMCAKVAGQYDSTAEDAINSGERV